MQTQNQTQNDYSLLRPFDLEAVNRGEEICYFDGEFAEYIAGPDQRGIVVIKSKNLEFNFAREIALRMKPLCWVEGKPVYEGDVLWYVNKQIKVTDIMDHYLLTTYEDCNWLSCEDGYLRNTKEMTWKAPNSKKETKTGITTKLEVNLHEDVLSAIRNLNDSIQQLNEALNKYK